MSFTLHTCRDPTLTRGRHLHDASHRETFESAHSVVLAIFAAHAQKATDSALSQDGGFTRKIVPFYANCLIDVSDHVFIPLRHR